MKVNEYFFDNDEADLYITVTVSTPGVAVTTVNVTNEDGSKGVSLDSGSNPTTAGSGLIKKSLLGKAKELANAMVDIDTTILLNLVPDVDWSNCFDNLVIKYYFEGGAAGQQPFFTCDADNKRKSSTGKTILVEKLVMLFKK